jgi:glucose 1-dehydrogenase
VRAIVTGVSRGIGRSICLSLARSALARSERVSIVATATGRSDDLQSVIEELKGLGCEAHGVAADLTDPEAPQRVVKEALEFAGGLDAMIHNAGFPIVGKLLDVKVRHWDLMFAINVRALLLLGRSAHGALKDSGGAICAIASTAAEMTSVNLTGYSASKAALVMLVQQMAYEWGPDGIRANCVSPGMTHSRSTEKIWADSAAVEFRERRLPLRRLGRPEDIGEAVAFLVSPGGGYITGENLNVDGGLRHVGMEYVLPPGTNYISPQAKG